ncbi:MAG: sigma-70 family RNA polymerase sigma factor [Gemmataceae bacterium]
MDPIPPPSSGGTSPTLLARLRTADAGAWERLVHLYSPLVFGWCRRTGLPAEDAADVMQDVWAAVAIAVPRFDAAGPGATFRGWLYTVTRSKLADHHRRQAVRPLAEGGSTARDRWADLPEAEPDDSLADPATGTAGVMRRALELLRGDVEPATFRAFWATAVEGRPAAEVAAELGVTAAVVYQAKSRLLRRLRLEFEGLLTPDVTP